MKTVVSSISYDSLWGHDGTWAHYHSTTEVPDFSDLANKADVTFVNQKISTLDSSFTSKVTTVEKKTEQSIKELKEFVIKSLSSKDRIESEKMELTQLFNALSSNIKEECQKIESQISSEIRAYQDVDKSLNDKLSILISQKNDFVKAKNNTSTILQELKQHITLANETIKNIKGNPNVVIHNFTKKIENISYITYFLLANVILADICLLFFLIN